ncbi:hypothetical protein K0M31_001990 [Melipona bicolor]|uniref:Uncharacterized protein n=1 Tax=Melipona bicolor TaxID=60889 RepID=A0AA40GGQ8_9HYME|nr:hypothetical protein K0M31_001990 [Melipona bicolor]
MNEALWSFNRNQHRRHQRQFQALKATHRRQFESAKNEEEKRDEAEEEYKPPRHRKITHAPNFISKLRSASRKQEGKGKTYLCMLLQIRIPEH